MEFCFFSLGKMYPEICASSGSQMQGFLASGAVSLSHLLLNLEGIKLSSKTKKKNKHDTGDEFSYRFFCLLFAELHFKSKTQIAIPAIKFIVVNSFQCQFYSALI